MADVTDVYKGELCVECAHVASGATIMAESKIRDFGHHGSFSPVDLLGAALGSCALNTMGYFAHSHGLDITGAEADATISMKGPAITAIELVFRMPARHYEDKDKRALENCVRSCPVHKSITPEIEQKIDFIWL